MTTAATTQASAAHFDVVSPELVLVDPRLAERARELLRDCLEARAREDEKPSLDDFAAEEARKRLLDAGVSLAVADEVPTPARRLRRVATFVAAGSATAATAVLALQAVAGSA